MIMYELNVCFHSNLVFKYSRKKKHSKIFKKKGLIQNCKDVYVDGTQGSEVGTLTKAWTTEELCFDSQQGKDFSLL